MARASRFPGGNKYIAYNFEKGMYLNEFCTGYTPDRNYAWVGTRDQFRNMQAAYPIGSDFVCVLDGREKDDDV